MGKKKKKSKGLWKRLRSTLFVLVFGLSLGTLVLVLLFLPMSGQRAGSGRAGASGERTDSGSAPQKKPVVKRQISSQQPNLQYEENIRPDFEEELHKVDLALVQSLMLEDIGLDVITHQEVTRKRQDSGTYHFQTLALAVEPAIQTAFLQRIRNFLQEWTEQTELTKSRRQPNRWEVRIQGRLTHALLFQSRAVSSPRQGSPGPKLALIIDDLGERLDQAEKLHALLGTGVTLSVLPFCTHTREIAGFSQQAGMEIMLHVPMEPEGYPEVNPGPGCLFVDMSSETIQEVFQRARQQVPGVAGTNNHMGSRFTADTRAMTGFLTSCRQQNLFFVDSLTTPRSKGTTVSARLGVPSLSRDIFIDNEQNVSAIIFQLQKAEQLARKIGTAVAIGHPYPETMAALEHWSQHRDPSVKLTNVSALLQDSARPSKETP